ncbi:MAG: sugar phosphate nucleotidyltransferase, partial [Anaerolineae bacterium]|nr:sugar phosphate nucleotidyltransferase [Anaerolineae bacterium]
MARSDIKVFILAGGLGTRIRPLFADSPKAMIPFNGIPFLEIQMKMLAVQGFTSFVLCIGHQAQKITSYFGNGQTWGWDLSYSREPTPLGTGGALRYAANHLNTTALILNGDTYLPMDYTALVNQHKHDMPGTGTITVVEMEDTRRYGQVMFDKQNRIQGFQEKVDSTGPGWVNAGVYILEPEILDYIQPDRPV